MTARMERWKEDYITKNYLNMPVQDIAIHLELSLQSVYTKAFRLGLKKDLHCWSEDEMQHLKKHYANEFTTDISKVINRTPGSIKRMASLLGVKKEQCLTNTLPVNHHYFDISGHNQYYILGFWAADGCVSKGNRHANYVIRFSQKEKGILEKIRKEFDSQHTITSSMQDGTQYYSFSFTSNQVYEFLYQFFDMPIERKSLTLKWPKSLPDKYACDFLRGLIDGDGAISCRESRGTYYLSFCTASKSMIDGFTMCIERHIGLSAKIYEYKNMYSIRYYGTKAACIAHFLYKDAELYLDRKYQKYLQMLEWLKGRRRQKLPPKTERLFSDILTVS